MNQLSFEKSYTIGQFKAEISSGEAIEVLKNEKTGKLFFSYGPGRTGAVATKGIPTKRPVISEVVGDNGEVFFLLHEQGEGGATKLATL